MKRTGLCLAAILLSLTVLLPVLSGCAGDTSPDETEPVTTAAATVDATVTEEATSEVPDIPDTVWNREFRVLGCGDKASPSFPTFEIYAEDYNGEAMNDAVFERNEKIKQKYGITVVQTLVDSTHNRIATSYSTGTDEFDLVFTYIYKIGGLAQRGYFYDMKNVDYIDFSKPWWNKNVTDTVSIKGHVYYNASDYSLRDKNRVQVIQCNDSLIADLRLDPIPAIVDAGEWTAEKMTQYVLAGTDDLNGDGKHTKEDRYGLALSSYDCFAALCFGCGVRLIDKDGDDGLMIVSDMVHDSNAVDAVLKMFTRECAMSPEDYERDWDIASDTFEDGRALFTINSITYVGYYSSNCTFDFTVLPCPMLDADQKAYYSMPEVRSMLFSIPVTNPDPDFTGFALEAFSAASTDSTKTTFIELYCKARNVRNADSVRMMNVVLGGIVFESSIFYSDTVPLYSILGTHVPTAKANVFQRYMSSFKNKAQTEIDKINTDFAN